LGSAPITSYGLSRPASPFSRRDSVALTEQAREAWVRLVRCSGNKAAPLPSASSFTASLDVSFPESELRLAPGSVLALYADGLIERRDSDIGSDVERLGGSLARLGGDGLDDLADGLLGDACHASADRADDIALLLTEYAPPR
jgi:hypothetical protein